MTALKAKRASPKPPLVIGWRELVALPDLGVAEMKAKIDTGARTSALHARDFHRFRQDDREWIEFEPMVAGAGRLKRCKAQLMERRMIKNTSGVPEERPVIIARLTLRSRTWPIEVSLTDREKMEFDLIIGRTAIRGRKIVVDPGKSYLAGPPETAES